MPNQPRDNRFAILLNWIAPPAGSPVDAWRRRIFSALLLWLTVLGLIAYVPSMLLALRIGDYDVVALDTAAYTLIVIALFARRLPFATRATVLATLPLALGSYFLFGYGLDAVAPVWLVVFPVFTATLIGRRAALLATAIVAFVYIMATVAVAKGALAWAAHNPQTLSMMVVNGIITVLLAAALSLAITAIFDGLAREALARAAAEEASVRIAHAINQSDGYVLLLNIDGSIATTNLAAQRLLTTETIPWDDAPWTIVRAGSPWAGTCDWKRADGSVMQLSGTISLVRDEQGTVTQLLATLRDVGRERFLEARLEQGQRLAAIGTLAGGIAHDFNNLLQPILSNTEAARTQLPDDSDATPFLDDVKQAAERARTLVRRILSFTRSDLQERRALDLGELLSETERLLRATLPGWVQLRCVSEPSVVVRAEAGEIQQVLLNLATNAAHAMPNGGTLHISASGVPVRDDPVLASAFGGEQFVAALQVKDTGTGMDEATIARAFEPFFTTKSVGRGTGLGLAMVHTTVTALGGIVVPHSRPGAGTTMAIYLPLMHSVQTQPVRASREGMSGVAHGRRHILVVDDEFAVLTAARRVLERLGWKVTALGDPQEAAACLAEDGASFDCLMTDLAMPGMSGVQLATIAAQLHPALPIILTTGYLDHELQPGDQQRISIVLPKPFTGSELEQALFTACAHRRG